ncbi:hypothetical protein HHK36_014944 [Tetracentron sinense]|uniref:Uncharacterized protein n=1 Tax=Tetracentron sinense TaxID=13715 RepID=A0A835DCC5_TETSI|nr:hypothetical protein HHK36_014944 [Tetracentron sinense]
MASYAFVVISFFLISPFASHSAEEEFSHCKPLSCGRLTNISYPFSNSSDCRLSIIHCVDDSKAMIELGREKYEVLEIFSNNKTIRIRDSEFIKHLRDKNCDELSNFTKPVSPHLSFEVMSPNLTFFICNKSVPYRPLKQEFLDDNYRDCGAARVLFFYDMNSTHVWQFEHLLGADCDVVQFPVHELSSLRNGDLLHLLEAGFDLQWSLPRKKDHKTRRWGFGLGVVLLFELLFSLMRDLGSSSMASYAFVVISFFLISPFASHSAEEEFSHCKPLSCGRLTNISYPFSNSSDCRLSIIHCVDDSKAMIELGREKYEVLEIFSNNKTIRIRDSEFIKHLRDKNCDELSNFTKPVSPHLSFEVMSPNLTFFICNKSVPYRPLKQEFLDDNYRDCGAARVLFFYDMNSTHDWQFEHLLGADCDVVQFPVHELASLRNGDLLSLLEAGFDLQWSLPPECQPCEHNGTFCLRNATGSFRCVDSIKGIAKKFSFLVVFFFFFN